MPSAVVMPSAVAEAIRQRVQRIKSPSKQGPWHKRAASATEGQGIAPRGVWQPAEGTSTSAVLDAEQLPHIVDAILSELLPPDLRSMRLLSRPTTEYVDAFCSRHLCLAAHFGDVGVHNGGLQLPLELRSVAFRTRVDRAWTPVKNPRFAACKIVCKQPPEAAVIPESEWPLLNRVRVVDFYADNFSPFPVTLGFLQPITRHLTNLKVLRFPIAGLAGTWTPDSLDLDAPMLVSLWCNWVGIEKPMELQIPKTTTKVVIDMGVSYPVAPDDEPLMAIDPDEILRLKLTNVTAKLEDVVVALFPIPRHHPDADSRPPSAGDVHSHMGSVDDDSGSEAGATGPIESDDDTGVRPANEAVDAAPVTLESAPHSPAEAPTHIQSPTDETFQLAPGSPNSATHDDETEDEDDDEDNDEEDDGPNMPPGVITIPVTFPMPMPTPADLMRLAQQFQPGPPGHIGMLTNFARVVARTLPYAKITIVGFDLVSPPVMACAPSLPEELRERFIDSTAMILSSPDEESDEEDDSDEDDKEDGTSEMDDANDSDRAERLENLAKATPMDADEAARLAHGISFMSHVDYRAAVGVEQYDLQMVYREIGTVSKALVVDESILFPRPPGGSVRERSREYGEVEV